MPNFYLTRRSCFALLGSLALAACSDAATPAAPGAGDSQPPLSVADDGAMRDDGIDARDTYFAFNVTTTRTTDGGAAADGGGGVGIASLEGEYETDESAYLEAGYGSDGSLRFNVYSDGADDPRLPDPPPVVRSIGNYVYVYDQSGGVTETYPFNDFLEGAGLPGGDLAVGSPYGSLYNPIGSRTGGGGGAREPVYMTGLDPERSKVHQVRDDVLQVTTTSGGGAGVQAAAEGGGAALSTTRTYRRRGVPTSDPAAAGETGQPPRAAAIPHWVLESVEQTATVPGARGSSTVRTRTTYQYVAAHINRGRDEQREKALREGGPPPASSAMAGARSMAPLDEPMTANSEDGINLCERGQANHVRTVSPGGAGVVYQHGFCSDATTWSAMRQRVPETHRVGVEQTYSLNSDANVESQVDDLTNRLASVGVPGNVVVSHSQGGLVARRLGQRRPDLVSGVVTIGTPHEGALIASRPAGMLADQLHDLVGNPCFGLVCTLAGEVAEGLAAGLLARGIGALVPAAGDDQPNSALIQRVNGRSQYQYENFRRASISMNVPPRWAIFRMLGDKRSSRDRLLRNEPLKGQRYARDAQRVYDAARVLRYMAMVLRWRATDYGYGWGCHQSGYSYYWEPCYNPYGYSYNWWRASYWYYVADALDYLAGTVIWVMDWFDRAWDEATTGRSGGTDGFVQLNSQQYPTYVPGSFPVRHFRITGAEAHSGETASKAVLDQLRPALDHAGVLRY